MDVDAFVAAHRGEWGRLEALVSRQDRLSGEEVDELVELYQRAATHLSMVRSSVPDPALVGRLSSLVARARSAVTGARTPAWRDAARFLAVTFPAIVYRVRWWWLGATVASCALAAAFGIWVALSPEVQATIGAPAEIRQLVEHDFEDYYSANPAASFAFQVWTNNVWVAAISLAFGILLGIPTGYVLFLNAVNVGVAGGLMFAYGKGAIFFGLILPHGLLELTAVFLAAGTGLRLGWTVIDPGPRRRGRAVAEEGRAAVAVAIGLVLVLAISGAIEAAVTPSGLPTAVRVGVGVLATVIFLGYVLVLGRRAVRAGETGDVPHGPDTAPEAG
ncbi:MAG: stage II sporulation protein M [Streptosporangiales bacterium]|nr:stage II sporulation protein M [Streptosporangiales bacterium]